jgi:tripartite-type tricarboxylate transporter receptor subunit TctC
MTDRLGRRAALALPALLAARGAAAQGWAPDRPIRVVVPFGPGNSTDAAARILAEALAPRLGRPVLVENRGGATTTLGAAEVARAAPDGHTLLLAPPPFVITQFAFPRLPYDPEAMRPIALVATSPVLLAVRADLPVRDMGELAALAKARPGALTYASVGVGSLPHVAAELVKLRAGGLDILHVPYGSGSIAATDLVAGRVDMFFTVELEVKPYVDSGRVRIIAVVAEARLPGRPDLPTLAEHTPGLRAEFWIGFLAPARTPDAVVERLNTEVNALLATPAIANRLRDIALTVAPRPPAGFAALLTAERQQWSEAVRAANIKIE